MAGTAAAAEVKEVKLADQFGLIYLPLYVVIERKLIEKHADRLGLGKVEGKLFRFSGGAAANDALLSKNVDFVAAGVGPLLTIWDKTIGRLNVRALTALADSPMTLVTSDPRINSIRDYKDGDRIALPAVKVSIQATVLQMAAEKAFGDPFAIDKLTVTMRHPDALAAILSGRSEVKTHFATIPFSSQELEHPSTRTVLTSYDVVGGRHTMITLYGMEEFIKKNPKTAAATYNAFREAFDWINANKRAASEIYIKYSDTKVTVDEIQKLVSDENTIFYTPTPTKTMDFARFMKKIDSIKNEPKSWKDLFFEVGQNVAGS
ncbi:MAG: ABC transporter substrate-binding protein [Alphaproteobacteria bacterium]|nr:ABC transporter substrate-binding protein [Alphaproteobacteria bacterium]